MAETKSKRTRKPQTTRLHQFPEVRGKTVEEVEIDTDALAIVILFNDNTALTFDLDTVYSVYPELRNRSKGNWRKIKRWPEIQSSPSVVKW